MTTLRSALSLAVSGLVAASGSTVSAQDRVEELLSQMTLEEKAGQMVQLTLQAVSAERQWTDTQHRLDEDVLRDMLVNKHVGSILNQYDAAFTPEHWRDVIGTIQEIAVEETRLGVPVVYAVDSVHGANYVVGATIFPQNINVAATWDPEHSRIAGEITALETRAVGIPWNFSPVADVARQPLWSRFFETFGEDPYLVGEMARANVEGQQNADVNVAACGKHFVGYSMPRSGKDRTPTQVGQIELLDTFVPPFEDMLDAGLMTMMINSGEVNGVPVHASEPLLAGLLRGQLGFDGVIVTDWEDVIKLHSIHKVADSRKEAARQAIIAGIDMSMVPYGTDFADHIVELVNEGAISEARIDESVRRILQLKEDMGLFEEPISPAGLVDSIGSEQGQQASLAAARESMVLLRNNDGALPLASGAQILVTGPTADALPPVYGSWSFSWQGVEPGLYPDTPTVLDAIRSEFGEQNVSYVPGSTFTDAIDLAAVSEAAQAADAVVLCLGEPPSTEKPGDIHDLDLDPGQMQLAMAAAEAGKPVIAVLLVNRPRTINDIESELDAVVWAGQPGPYGPQAIAELLSGELNPSGRLPFTYSRTSGSVLTYDRKWTEDLAPNFQMQAYTPLFEFGSGLAYTSYAYSELQVSTSGDTLTVSINVANTGNRAGIETVQVYVTDEYASVTPHAQRLRGFDRVELAAGESRRVTLEIPKDRLTLINQDGARVFEPGGFVVNVGGQSARFEW